MRPKLSEQVVVITGASSGIGRETSLLLGKNGATVVLAARNEGALMDVALEVEHLGGRALPVVTDVSNWNQVEQLAVEALRAFGRIDTWINNAAVSEFARFQDMTIDEIDRIIQVDLLGQIYGTKAALEHMLSRQEGGIINVSSLVGERAIPLQSVYCAAKHGIKGFTESVRLELEADRIPISMSLILPGSINTPFFTHARSKLGAKPQPMSPVYDPSLVAEAILDCCLRPKTRVTVGAAAKAYELWERMSPRTLDRYMTQTKKAFKEQTSNQPDLGVDSLFQPLPEQGSSRGEFTSSGGQASNGQTQTGVFEKYPILATAAMGAAVIGAFGLLRGLNNQKNGSLSASTGERRQRETSSNIPIRHRVTNVETSPTRVSETVRVGTVYPH